MREKFKKVWNMLLKEKYTRLNHIDDSLFYKRICASKYKKEMQVYDTSTEVYRPLTGIEIDELLKVGAENFSRGLKMKSLIDQYHYERASFHRESIKGNIKKRDYHFHKAINVINQLRELK